MNMQSAVAAAPPQVSAQTMPPAARLTQMIMSCFVSQAISVAAELGVADLLANKPQSIADLATATGAHKRSLYRVLRALASVGVFSEIEPEVFALTPLAEPLVSDRADSLRDAAVFIGANWHWQVYGEMLHSVRTGEAAWKRVHGAEVFPYFEQHAPQSAIFNRAMSSFSMMALPVVAAAAQHKVFDNAATVMDVAGGHGFLLAAVLRANPQLSGVLFDLPEVVAAAPEFLEKEAVRARVEIAAGSFFEAIPADCDVYLMKHIIHDWDDERAVKILSNARRAMRQSSKLLIVEQVIPAGDAPHPGKIMDLEMLVSPGGVERTENEYREILRRADLKLARVIPSASPLSIIEAIKA